MSAELLQQIVTLFGLTVLILFLCNRFRIPNVVGFLVSGILVGKHGLGLIGHEFPLEQLSEIGVVLLLFSIGIEFSLSELKRIKHQVILGGSLQVFLTLGTVAIVTHSSGLHWNESIFLGFLLALSSTAIVLKLLQSRDEINSPHGRLSLAILIYQDIIVVPMMLLVPILAGHTANLAASLTIMVLKGAGIIILTLFSAQYVMPWILYQVARLRSQELFLLSVIVVCFAIALGTFSLGLSISLGAFLAGLIISESEYSHQTLSMVIPFRDLFTSFFFISIGMIMDLGYAIAHPIPVFLVALGILFLKAIIAGFTAFLMGFALRTTILVGLALNQVGEFSFVLAAVGLKEGLLRSDHYNLFLAVSVITMAAAPILQPLSYKLSTLAAQRKMPDILRHGWRRPKSQFTEPEELTDHLIIVGFGLSGQNIAAAALSAQIPYVILDMNASVVLRERKNGIPIYYGDATQESMLNHLNLKRARVLVVAIPDPLATRAIVLLARRLNAGLYIIVRTQYMREMQSLLDLGADEVIPAEFETSIEIFTIVLTKYLVPQNTIDEFVEKIREGGYQMLRTPAKHSVSIADMQQNLSGINISTFHISGESILTGRTLEEISLRQKYGVNLLAIVRDEEVLSNPDADTSIMPGDKILVSGRPEQIFAFSEVLFGKRQGGGRRRSL